MKHTWTTGEGPKRAGTVAGVGVAATLGLVAIVTAARALEDRVGVRNTVYSLMAAALLFVVLVEAVHHRLVHEHVVRDDRSWGPEPSTNVAGSEDPIVQELRLAARLGAELMGEAPVSRTSDRPEAPAA